MSVGVNVTPGWGDTVDGRDLPEMARRLETLGADAIRMPFADHPGTYATWKWCVDRGMDVVVHDDPSNYPAVEDLVEKVAAQDLPVFLQGWNEPDLSGLPDWQALAADRQTRLYEAVAGRFPVLSQPTAQGEFWEFAMGLPHDVVSVHRYAFVEPNAGHFALPATDRPVWVTEVGWPTYKQRFWFWSWWTVSERQQRDWLVFAENQLRANGAAKVFVYKLSDDGTDLFVRDQGWGLFTVAGRAKLAASALA